MPDTLTYDLGEIERPVSVPSHPSRATQRPALHPRVPARLCATCDLLLPGSGQLLGGRAGTGGLQLASLALIASLAWALWVTLERVAATASVLGSSRGFGLWLLGGLYLMAALAHLGSVLGASRPAPDDDRGVAPLLAATASLLLPGWGQLLNGHRRRAALLVGGLWCVGFSWLLVSPWLADWLLRLDLHLPVELVALTSPVFRWTLPAVLWSLAVYDAAFCAATRD